MASAYQHNPDPVRFINNEWGFWDEAWCDWTGGFTTEAEARKALAEYCTNVLGD